MVTEIFVTTSIHGKSESARAFGSRTDSLFLKVFFYNEIRAFLESLFKVGIFTFPPFFRIGV